MQFERDFLIWSHAFQKFPIGTYCDVRKRELHSRLSSRSPVVDCVIPLWPTVRAVILNLRLLPATLSVNFVYGLNLFKSLQAFGSQCTSLHLLTKDDINLLQYKCCIVLDEWVSVWILLLYCLQIVKETTETALFCCWCLLSLGSLLPLAPSSSLPVNTYPCDIRTLIYSTLKPTPLGCFGRLL
jgi:hypothetical protein